MTVGSRFIGVWWLFLFISGTLFLRAEEPSSTPKENPEVSEVVPLYDAPDTLKRLDTSDPIWVTADRQAVVLVGVVSLREGLLEFFACRKNSKEYESIIVLDVKPYLIHAALLVIGAKKGHPARFEPEFTPPDGDEIEILVRWKDETGSICELPAREMIREGRKGEPINVRWVFTGSVTGKDENGKSYYLANITGELIGIANFAGTILDVPFESSSENEDLVFEPNTEKIPPLGTEVTLVLRTVRK